MAVYLRLGLETLMRGGHPSPTMVQLFFVVVVVLVEGENVDMHRSSLPLRVLW